MVKQPRNPDQSTTQFHPIPQRRTSPLIWATAVIISFIAVAVIIAGVAVFVSYLAIRPKLPALIITEAQLNDLYYSQTGQLAVQMTIIIKAQNNNLKAHATFSHTQFRLSFHGLDIAELQSDPFDVPKNSSELLPYSVVSREIPLEPRLQYLAEDSIREGVVLFYLKGKGKTRWRIGPFGSAKFWLHVNCELRLPINRTVVYPHCSSKSKPQ